MWNHTKFADMVSRFSDFKTGLGVPYLRDDNRVGVLFTLDTPSLYSVEVIFPLDYAGPLQVCTTFPYGNKRIESVESRLAAGEIKSALSFNLMNPTYSERIAFLAEFKGFLELGARLHFARLEDTYDFGFSADDWADNLKRHLSATFLRGAAKHDPNEPERAEPYSGFSILHDTVPFSFFNFTRTTLRVRGLHWSYTNMQESTEVEGFDFSALTEEERNMVPFLSGGVVFGETPVDDWGMARCSVRKGQAYFTRPGQQLAVYALLQFHAFVNTAKRMYPNDVTKHQDVLNALNEDLVFAINEFSVGHI